MLKLSLIWEKTYEIISDNMLNVRKPGVGLDTIIVVIVGCEPNTVYCFENLIETIDHESSSL